MKGILSGPILRPVGAEIVDRQADIVESHLASDLGEKIEVVNRLIATPIRSVVRDTAELIFILLAFAAAIAVGTEKYLPAVFGTHSQYPDTWLINGLVQVSEIRQLSLEL